MTREEKINVLKELSDCSYIGSLSSEDKEAFEEAIQDLEKLEKIEQLIDNWTKTEELEWKIREVLDND